MSIVTKIIPEDWQTNELFDYLQACNVISKEDTFDMWMHDRTDMLRWVKEEVEGN